MWNRYGTITPRNRSRNRKGMEKKPESESERKRTRILNLISPHRIKTGPTDPILVFFQNWNWASGQNRPVIDRTETDFRNVVCAAERVLDKGKIPVALFIDLVSGKRWDFITQAQEDAALARIQEFHNRNGPRSPRRRSGDANNETDSGETAEPLKLSESIGGTIHGVRQTFNGTTVAQKTCKH